MKMTRRNFIQTALLTGGSIIGTRCSPADNTGATPVHRTPLYLELDRKGLLEPRVEEIWRLYESCELCPRRCKVNRLADKKGYCRAGLEPVVASHQPHFGEELPLVGRGGSGTIFFSNCNLRCVFCQNWPIAHQGRGHAVTHERLAGMMLELQRLGCHNINLVTPTHVMPNILKALAVAARNGLRLPLVYNTGGYERAEIVAMLDGIVDIYMPDMKFMLKEGAATYMDAPDYPEMAAESVKEMHRQVGELRLDNRRIAWHGLMIRHLVMPNRVAGTREFTQWVARNLSKNTYVNIMAQYRVEYRAFEFPNIGRAITSEEFVEAIKWAREEGLTRIDERSVAQFERMARRMG